ncbi:MAG: Smr/MutS family protein [Bacteroidales bacterium]|nr:Smr/MutS family protein [Bacteroidales bacterium]
MVYPNNFEQKIGFDNIRNLIKENCLGDAAKEQADNLHMFTQADIVQSLLKQTEEFISILNLDNSFPTEYYFDARVFLKKLNIVGMILETQELFDLIRSLETINKILKFFASKTDEEFPELKKLAGPVNVHKYVLDRCNAVINKHGKIKDNASSQLQSIRFTLAQKQSSVSKKLVNILGKVRSEGWVESDLSATMVNGRMVIPISSTYKRKIPGLVHDESATGKTSYIEPSEIVELNNEIKELEYEENREIRKILAQISEDIRPYLDELFAAYDFMGLIDFIRAKARLAIRLEAVCPGISENGTVFLANARHPLLYLSFKNDNRTVVPLNLKLDKNKRILLISGPNAGGKSVCLKTTGLIQYMFQCGIPVPLSPVSELPVFQSLFIDIGDEQSIENDLSTYSSHLLNMKNFIKHADKNSLILIDEFGTGTEPMLGGAIAESILDKLNKNEVFGVITTHYTNLKHFAATNEGLENGAMLFDNHKMQPVFQLQMGMPGSSFAFEIAAKIGLPKEILDKASEKIGKEQVDFDKHLRDVLRDKSYWENKRKKIKQQEKKLDELVEKYLNESNSIEKERKKIIQQAKNEADIILSGINKKIENTIHQIKEANAEKEKTRELRSQIESIKTETKTFFSQEDEKIEKKIVQIREKRERQAARRNEQNKILQEKAKTYIEDEKEKTIRYGDKVRMIGQQAIGEVIDLGEKNLVVAFGDMITSIDREKVEKISNKEFNSQKRKDKFEQSSIITDVYNRKLNFKPNIDLRGKRADEALQEIVQFIDEAIICGAGELQILHGTGTGALRELIRNYLKTVPQVTRFGNEHIERGGSGITIVTLE